jgi:hypothetical protein
VGNFTNAKTFGSIVVSLILDLLCYLLGLYPMDIYKTNSLLTVLMLFEMCFYDFRKTRLIKACTVIFIPKVLFPIVLYVMRKL